MSYEDKRIDCRDCGGQFTFSAGEQAFYDAKGFLNAPTRCPLRRKQLKGHATNEAVAGNPCPHDESGQGSFPRGTLYVRQSYGAYGERSTPRRMPPPDVTDLPDAFVAATIVRIDHGGRFAFVNVPSLNQDAYVHATVLATLATAPYEQQHVLVIVRNSERGLRATAIKSPS